MSVDFGGEFMKIAIVKPGVPMEIVLNKESKRKTPAVVFIKDGERSFGEAALSAAMRHPRYCYRYVHELLGKHYDNPLVREFQQRHPQYQVIKDQETGGPIFVHDESTTFTPEELIAMMLQKAKEFAESFTEQSISEAVLTVPPFYNQAERRAMARAGELAGLKILQLLNDNSAVALNYGVFRRKSFNSTPLSVMFFDIGASSTVTSIVEYAIVKHKSPTSGLVDSFPQVTVRGVGFDRQLGGNEIQRRLRDHLAAEFNKVKRSHRDVTTDPKAMQKLYKEAGRVKQVLSANTDHFAQVESLLDDEDFRVKITREELETMCEDLFQRVQHTVREALEAAEMRIEEIGEVILMGGGTRVPRIQKTLMDFIKREDLGKGINTDEAAALGAVYQAAFLGKGFKVQKFNIKDASIYPIQVTFEKVKSEEEKERDSEGEGEGEKEGEGRKRRMIQRVLFNKMQPYPQKKMMTFNKHTKDFEFTVQYGDLSFLTQEENNQIGNKTLATIALTGIEEAFKLHSNEKKTVAKGIKTHFKMDDSGIFHVENVEVVFEKIAEIEVEEEEEKEDENQESTFSKIGKSFKKFFGGGEKKEDNQVEDQKDEPIEQENNETKINEENKKEDNKEEKEGEKEKEGEEEKEKENEEEENNKKEKEKEKEKEDQDKKEKNKTEETKSNETLKTDENKNKNIKIKKEKIIVLKEKAKFSIINHDLADPSNEYIDLIKKNIEYLKHQDDQKAEVEKTKNEIETFIFEARDKMDQSKYQACSTQSERDAILNLLNSASDWMEELEDNVSKKVLDEKLFELRKSCEELYKRVFEEEQRPVAMEALLSRINQSEYFLAGMKNFTGNKDEQPFTEVEYNTLDSLIKDIKKWNKTINDEQKKLKCTQKPIFTFDDVVQKVNQLDREIKYLINKIKTFQPKTTTTTTTTTKIVINTSDIVDNKLEEEENVELKDKNDKDDGKGEDNGKGKDNGKEKDKKDEEKEENEKENKKKEKKEDPHLKEHDFSEL